MPEYPKDWDKIRERVFERDEYKCIICGNQGARVHHLIRSDPPNNSLINLVTMCKGCQSAYESSWDYPMPNPYIIHRRHKIAEKLKEVIHQRGLMKPKKKPERPSELAYVKILR